MKTYNTKKFFKFIYDHQKGWFFPLALTLVFVGVMIRQSTDIDYYFDNEYGTLALTWGFLSAISITIWLATFYLYYRDQHDGYKLYTIKKGKHRSGFYFRPILFRKNKIRKYSVIMHNSCMYHFKGQDKFDINKLYGFSIGMNHHNNSRRVGWVANPEKNTIDLYNYDYDQGDRSYKKIDEVIPMDEPFEISFKHDESINRKIGYGLFPYFGGNNPAPHDMHIFIKRIK